MMDYYIFITRSCNLRCSYCCFGDSVFQREASRDEALDPIATAEFISEQAEKRPNEDNKVFFYGGEPSLKRGWIKTFIEATEGRGQLRYVLQTNGTKLAAFDPELLKKVHFLEISIDGVEAIHDELRGSGTHTRVVENIAAIRPWYRGEIAARMTYTPQNPLARSVRYLFDELHVDHVYWMHEDSETPVSAWASTRETYSTELDELIDYWLTSLRSGRPKQIIPFKSIMSSLLEPPELSCFRCGVGTTLRVIDLDGACYSCDLMITDDKRHAIGHIADGMRDDLLPHNDLYESRCKTCDELTYCGGRCFNISFNQDERFDEFCQRTKLLIGKLRPHTEEVRMLLEAGTIDAGDVHIETTLTEQIP